MVYLLKMVIFHGKLLVITRILTRPAIYQEQVVFIHHINIVVFLFMGQLQGFTENPWDSLGFLRDA